MEYIEQEMEQRREQPVEEVVQKQVKPVREKDEILAEIYEQKRKNKQDTLLMLQNLEEDNTSPKGFVSNYFETCRGNKELNDIRKEHNIEYKEKVQDIEDSEQQETLRELQKKSQEGQNNEELEEEEEEREEVGELEQKNSLQQKSREVMKKASVFQEMDEQLWKRQEEDTLKAQTYHQGKNYRLNNVGDPREE